MIEIKLADTLCVAQIPADRGDLRMHGHVEIEMRDGTLYTLGAGPWERNQYGQYRGLRKFCVLLPDGERIEIKTTVKVTRARCAA